MECRFSESKLLYLIAIISTLVGCATVPTTDTEAIKNAPEKRVTLAYDFLISAVEGPSRYELRVLLPKDYPGRQRVLEESFSIEPTEIIDEGTTRYAVFRGLGTEETKKVSIHFTLATSNPFLGMETHGLGEVTLGEDRRAEYLSEEKYLETSSSVLVREAKKLKGNDDSSTIKNILQFLSRHLEYTGYNPLDVGALAAYRSRRGDCTEYTDLFVALCRMSGIPARFVEGYTVRGEEKRHDWAEVFMEDVGWMPVDPTVSAGTGKIVYKPYPNSYIYLTTKRADKMLFGYHYWGCWYWEHPVTSELVSNIDYERGKT